MVKSARRLPSVLLIILAASGHLHCTRWAAPEVDILSKWRTPSRWPPPTGWPTKWRAIHKNTTSAKLKLGFKLNFNASFNLFQWPPSLYLFSSRHTFTYQLQRHNSYWNAGHKIAILSLDEKNLHLSKDSRFNTLYYKLKGKFNAKETLMPKGINHDLLMMLTYLVVKNIKFID